MARNKAKKNKKNVTPKKSKKSAKSKVVKKAKKVAKVKAKAKAKVKAQPKASQKLAKTNSPSKSQKSNVLSKVFTPLDDRILIRVEKFVQTVSGLFIPSTAQDKPQKGEVLAVGRGHRNAKGRIRPMDVQVGDQVYFGPYTGSPIEVGSEEALILRESEVLAVEPK